MAKDLLPGENLIMKVHQHWIFVAESLVVPAALLVLVAISDFTFLRTSGHHIRTIVSLAAIGIALLWLIVIWIRWQSTVYTLTDQRIMIESGVFSRSEKIIPIDRVQACSTKVSLIGRMLGYGHVLIDSAGEIQGAEVLEHLPDPGRFRDQVFMQTERRRGAPASQPAPSGL